MEEHELIELPNGIRIVHKQITNTKIAHVGIMLDIGSRDEFPEEQGLAHFWEHMAFKGTKKRRAFHIINRLDSLGGELNAYTTREKICFYASLLDNHLDKAVELLADITFNSTFPLKEIEKERMVILEEMAMYRDTPEDAIQDDFDEQVFHGHPLGKNILGTPATVGSFQQADFLNFLQRNLNTEKIILSSVGNYSIKKLQRLVEKHIKPVPHKNHTPQRNYFESYKPTIHTVKKPITQAHVAIGRTSYSLKDENRIPFFLLVNILGGPSMNSRLNLSLREKHGFVYGIDANYTPYFETGSFGIYFATDPKNLKKSLKLVQKELDLLKQKPMGNLQLHKAKQQLKGQLAMSEENNNAMMLMMAKSILDLNKIPDINHIFRQIDATTSDQLMELARVNFSMENMCQLTYLPE
ncbi:M16 family metallopeptidase [Marinoscillum furvescens]|uniref:Putative Zn-dependent peptidase n=1 Tax=Marinoscillum furvescens DSM 4134 TaxID=1122208 RepID=A0A3D9LIV2_MARFU|nr:pitrilysin family protein [Marinoscillum furvescens]REE05795.1 putative Zn-dependent peptidase [Marinoscillum furvescens DSM 4134]